MRTNRLANEARGRLPLFLPLITYAVSSPWPPALRNLLQKAKLTTNHTCDHTETNKTNQDIYALPCTMCPLAVHPSTFFKSASFVVVNRAVGLSSGLGIRYGLTTLDGGLTLTPQRDPGFFLAREPTYDPSKAVLLGWVEEDQLSFFDSIIETVPVPRVVGSGLETKEWLLAVAGKLEMEGIVSNGDILLDDILVLRQ